MDSKIKNHQGTFHFGNLSCLTDKITLPFSSWYILLDNGHLGYSFHANVFAQTTEEIKKLYSIPPPVVGEGMIHFYGQKKGFDVSGDKKEEVVKILQSVFPSISIRIAK